ncbi:hypothetical protein B0J13DRAFT_562649 [Dactylonectria estremocensis]|uniref:Non-canonical purine NTP phosphatase/PRRC1 domain-containing protein n=1 Tax=Dactylonectria estremocensis TaxID=1079267 RepID=A0A9P9IUF0_9HYPO|nr:hypothetical protein B0J13DRAFT_562649 [Dactylonectria estremocensis]
MSTIKIPVVPELQKTLEEVRNTQKIVPPPQRRGQLRSFPARSFETYGDGVMVVTPTGNESKMDEVSRRFAKFVQPSKLQFARMHVGSNVGEQPYDEEGLTGGFNRLNGAFDLLETPMCQTQLKDSKIGTVIGMSIESFMQLEFEGEKIMRAVDYAAIIVHNATTGKSDFTISEGVPMNPAYVEIARSLGFEDAEKKHGKVTGGKVFAAHVPGVDHADWQAVVTGVTRYDTLRKAMDKMKNPLEL